MTQTEQARKDGREQTRVQSDNLLSQPDPDAGVAEEVSLDQQSGQARQVGHAPPEAEQALADALRPAKDEKRPA